VNVTDLLQNPRGARVAVVGGGRTGAAAARLLVALGAHVSVHDDAPPGKLAEGLGRYGVGDDLLASGAVVLHGGGLDRTALAGADLIVLSPGVPRAHAALAAEEGGALGTVPCVNELELGYAQLVARGAPDGVRVLGITGTNGKSTTTTMTGAIARARDPLAFVGGNLGLPLCAAVQDGLQPGTAGAPRLLVVELSSYQLETLRFLPVHAGAVTNLTPDHLDRYVDADAYYAAKARLFGLVTDGGGIALNAADPETERSLVPHLPGTVMPCHFDVSSDEPGIEIEATARGARLFVRPQGLALDLDNPRIVGHHNRQNAAAAAALALLVGIDAATIQAGLNNWEGIEHRLERVGVHRGITWWNDSKATNVDAAVTALKSFSTVDGEGRGGVHLIAGGLGKGAPYAPLVDASRGRVVAVYTVGKDAPAIAAAYAGVVDVIDCGDLARACAAAAARAHPGQHVLLSPACASFDQFRDYAQRGEQFRAHFATASGGVPDGEAR
jgi:UDP-N-acetylmuramoylalanine--D-glutamate ligase